jgi:hypothetical protein
MKHIVNRPGPRCNPALQFLPQIFSTQLTQRACSLTLTPGHFCCNTMELNFAKRRLDIIEWLLPRQRHQGLTPQSVGLPCQSHRLGRSSSRKEIKPGSSPFQPLKHSSWRAHATTLARGGKPDHRAGNLDIPLLLDSRLMRG